MNLLIGVSAETHEVPINCTSHKNQIKGLGSLTLAKSKKIWFEYNLHIKTCAEVFLSPRASNYPLFAIQKNMHLLCEQGRSIAQGGVLH